MPDETFTHAQIAAMATAVARYLHRDPDAEPALPAGRGERYAVADRAYQPAAEEFALTIRFACDPVIIRAEAMRLREACWQDAEDWAQEHGGVDAIPVVEALYEIIAASSPDPVAPVDRGFELVGWEDSSRR